MNKTQILWNFWYIAQHLALNLTGQLISQICATDMNDIQIMRFVELTCKVKVCGYSICIDGEINEIS